MTGLARPPGPAAGDPGAGELPNAVVLVLVLVLVLVVQQAALLAVVV